MEIIEKVMQHWMDQVYVAILETTGNGVYKYDSKLLAETLQEITEDPDKKD